MKILLVSSSILPQSGGSSIIVENLAKNFTSDQMIVLGSSMLNQKNNVARKTGGPVFYYFFSELSIFGRGARFFDWFRRWMFKPLVRKIKRLIVQEGITHVVGVYPNQFYCLAACQAAKAMKVPFSSYFHNTYVENVAIKDPNAQKQQDEIFEYSDQVFVMSKGMQRFYQEKYRSDKFIPLVHTFDEYPNTKNNSILPGAGKEKYNLVAIGNFNQSNLDATKRLVDAVRKSDRYTLTLYTHVPKILLSQRGLDTSAFEYKGSIGPDEIHSALQQYDICVLTHGFEGDYGEVEYKTIFPTRTIPLLLSGKPIFAHSPKESFLNSFLIENQCAELVDEAEVSKIIDGLDKLANDANYQKQLTEKAVKAADQFYGQHVVNQFLKHLVDR